MPIPLIVWGLGALGAALLSGCGGDDEGQNTPEPDAAPINHAPVIDPIDDVTLREGESLSLYVQASDPDGDSLTYSAQGLPQGASFNQSTRRFSWTPDYDQAGQYGVEVSVSDGDRSDSESFTIRVEEGNQAPAFDPIDTQVEVNEGDELSFAIHATDPDNDSLTYWATGLPEGASFDAVNLTFSWIPDFNQSGEYVVTFHASDGENVVSQTVAITVAPENHFFPELNAIGHKEVNEGETLNFTLSAVDPDSSALTFSAENLPDGASLNPDTREFQWTPTHYQAGEYPNIIFTVSDGEFEDSEIISITVNNVIADKDGDGYLETVDCNDDDPTIHSDAVEVFDSIDNNCDGAIDEGFWLEVSAGGSHSCGIGTDGVIRCWGHNSAGQASPPAGDFTQVSAGYNHSCGLRMDGAAVCWGNNNAGQASPPAGDFIQVSAGRQHSCGLLVDGSIVCWGLNDDGQSTPPAGEFIQVEAGISRSCGIGVGGSAECWGLEGSIVSYHPPGTFIQVGKPGYNHVCGIRADHSLYCWGLLTADTLELMDLEGFVQVGTGDSHSCGLMVDGTVACGGFNSYDQSDPPVGNFSQISSGGNHNCGVMVDGTITCWGNNDDGQSAPVEW